MEKHLNLVFSTKEPLFSSKFRHVFLILVLSGMQQPRVDTPSPLLPTPMPMRPAWSTAPVHRWWRERREAWSKLVSKRKRAKDASSDTLRMFYELQLTQAQLDDRLKADVDNIRSLAGSLARKDVSDAQVADLIRRLKQNPEYTGDPQQFAAAFRHRWVYSGTGTNTCTRTAPSLSTKTAVNRYVSA